MHWMSPQPTNGNAFPLCTSPQFNTPPTPAPTPTPTSPCPQLHHISMKTLTPHGTLPKSKSESETPTGGMALQLPTTPSQLPLASLPGMPLACMPLTELLGVVLSVAVAEGTALWLAVDVLEAVLDTLPVGLDDLLAVMVRLAVWVADGRALPVAVGVRLALCRLVAVGLAVPVQVRAMPGPCLVSPSTATATPKPPKKKKNMARAKVSCFATPFHSHHIWFLNSSQHHQPP